MENEVTLDAKTLHWEREAIEKLLMADLRERRAARRWRIFRSLVWMLLFGALIWLLVADMLPTSKTTVAHTAMVTLRAATHSQRRSGAWLTSSSTVASAEGPASAGTASGTIRGSVVVSSAGAGGGGNTMRSAIRNSTTAPASCNDSCDRFITRRKPSPRNMKASSSTKAINTSRRITRGRRAIGTLLSALAKMGMLPSGSVIRSSKMVAETKV